jgi:hypothetical protein
MDVRALVSGLAECDLSAAARHELEGCAEASARVRAWLDGFDVQVGRALEVKSGYGAKVLADAMNLSLAAGTRVIERGETLRQIPAVEGAVHAGEVSGAHVDVITRALRQVPKARRGELASVIDERVRDARSLPANEYEDLLKVEVRRLQDGDDDKRKKKSIRFRSWVDKVFGMWRASMALDPATAVWVEKRITDEFDRLFADGVPDDAPDDPIERQQYLAALAVLSLLRGEGGSTGRPEVIVVVDATQADALVDWDLPVDVPPDAFADVVARAKVHVVAIWPPTDLDLGRSQRLANAAQRRALRALYPTCAIPGCTVRFSRCKVHHVWEWEQGGPTDFDNLLPLCSRHHQHFVHDKGWELKLLPDRTLEITLPDGTTMTTGPPTRAP